MTNDELDTLDALAAAATEGPWEQVDSRAYSRATGLMVCLCNETDADAAFIADARYGVPALVAEVRRLREDAARWAYVRDAGAVVTRPVTLPDGQQIAMGRVGGSYATQCVDVMRQLYPVQEAEELAIVDAREGV